MNKDSDGVPDVAIEQGLAAVRARIERSQRERAELDKQISADREEEKLLARLLALRRGEEVAIQPAPARSTGDRTNSGTEETQNSVVAGVLEELSSAGRPIHISELMRLLERRQIALPGAGTQANVIVHLRRDPRIVRPSRGTYALAEWGLTAMAPVHRRRRRRRIKVKAKTH
jgi:hypothetical protein